VRARGYYLYPLLWRLRKANGGRRPSCTFSSATRLAASARFGSIPVAHIKRASALRDGIAYAAYRTALEAALKQDRIDLLYIQEFWTPRFDFVSRMTSIPVIGADHGAIYADWMAPAKRASLQRAFCVICQTKRALDRARDFGGKAILVSNGVDTDFFVPPASHQRPKTVLAVGRLVEGQKRFSDLLRAMQALHDFSLILAGTGPHEAALKRLAAELGVADRVDFPGFVSDRTELRRLYQECGVFVATSAWEGMPLVMLDAMSCAAPVVGGSIRAAARARSTRTSRGKLRPKSNCVIAPGSPQPRMSF
jgi:glycosyltransferase involved in cell wall biosynthesis